MKTEFADREIFGSLVEEKVLGAEYQRYWNQERQHSGIGYKTPAEFAAEEKTTRKTTIVPTPHLLLGEAG
jgi:Integrase core domain